MRGFTGPDDRFPPVNAEDATADQTSAAGRMRDQVRGRVRDENRDHNREQSRDQSRKQSNRSGVLDETELDSALQLLVERAQYITGATGTALALPLGEEMVCRASTGSCAPAVGARLQVRSGLTGESISRRQLLRCDNAETDPRVNLEACRALGIASIVVLPLLRRSGEVRGLFELFSDHPYAFEERDLVALERMADLTLTALDLAEQDLAGQDLAEQGQSSVPASAAAPTPALRREAVKPVEFPTSSVAEEGAAADPLPAESAERVELPDEMPLRAEAAHVPEAMLRVQKCASCGFPVSEGRMFCLDCEKRDSDARDFEKKRLEHVQGQTRQGQVEQDPIEAHAITRPEPDTAAGSGPDLMAPAEEDFAPAFLANYPPADESWMANHLNLLALVVLILIILVAVVVFR